ncbi:TRAP transporter small permease [Geoalkalibacter halelectricus]|uniref:TRAP transporter small permease n=1 Tax=Geoalkalibacter halelectricus TaxID=2847045 RepID=UPI003D1FC8FC
MWKKTARAIDKTLAFVEEWSLFIAVMTALIVALANVFLRKFTPISLYWSDEVVRKVIFFTTYVGASAAVRSRSLIRVDALPQLFPVLKRGVTLLSHLAALFFAGIMVWLGWQMTVMAYQDEFARTSTLQIAEWKFYAVLPAVGVMMFIRSIIVMVEDWKGGPAGE